MKLYNALDWYWIVGGDENQVYSSVRGAFFPVSDAAFISWSSDGSMPARIDTTASLGAVIPPQATRPVNAGVLAGFTAQQASSVTDLAVFKVLFNHENRLRALEGKAALTTAQAIAAIKALM